MPAFGTVYVPVAGFFDSRILKMVCSAANLADSVDIRTGDLTEVIHCNNLNWEGCRFGHLLKGNKVSPNNTNPLS